MARRDLQAEEVGREVGRDGEEEMSPGRGNNSCKTLSRGTVFICLMITEWFLFVAIQVIMALFLESP